ncbi:hypothetical protein [Streptomyces canus]|uniref:hypothetical protein n=1 Tax=Streptomyces canus TaxID=58343 RepID=UPI002E25BC38
MNATVTPVKVRGSKLRHYSLARGFMVRTVGCAQNVTRKLTDEQAAELTECRSCAAAVAEMTPAAEEAPAAPAKDVIRVATRAYTNGSVKGLRTYLHINCGCRIASTLMGTYGTMDDARRKASELVEGTGDYYRTCSKSGLVKAQALGRSVRYFDDTLKAGASTFDGAGVRDGDVVVVASEGVVGIAIRTAVIAITAERGHLRSLDTSARTFRDGLYAEIVDRAEAEARKIRATVDPLHAAPAAEEVTPADVVRTDGVKVKADGRGKWAVVRGGDYLGVVFDEGLGMKRGRFAGWSPYAGTPGNTTAFSDDPAEVVESIVQAWPVTAAELVAESGLPLDDVLAMAHTVTEEWKADGRRAVLAIAAASGQATRMTREAAAEVRTRLLDRPARYVVPVGRDDREHPRFRIRRDAVACAASYGIPEERVVDTVSATAPAEEEAPAEDEPAHCMPMLGGKVHEVMPGMDGSDGRPEYVFPLCRTGSSTNQGTRYVTTTLDLTCTHCVGYRDRRRARRAAEATASA